MNTPNPAVRQDTAAPDGKTTFDGVALAEMATAVRALAIDSITSERQGHPGMPLGMADVATVLFTQFLKYHAEDPAWPDRDRLVVSNGHGSTLLYALLHLTGYPKMTVGELKSSRRLGSLAPGHPEYGHTPGVEVTTGPLGQGMANALGMAMAERMMAARFGDDLVSHYTYVFAGDGCLMEGIAQEAITLAGCLRLSKLIVLFDDNRVTIDGPTSLVTAEDHLARFRAAGWSAEGVDGHDMRAVATAIARARGSDRPSLIACRTVIGLGIPGREGLSTAHHGALSAAEAAGARKRWGWTHAPFEIPKAIQEAWRKAGARGAADHSAWKRRLDSQDPARRRTFEEALEGRVPEAAYVALDAVRERLAAEAPTLKGTATSQHVLEALLPLMPNLIGGSADLSAPNGTQTHGHVAITPGNFGGSYIYYGIREHAMAAAMNGMALHGGLIPYGGTFLAFSDYARPAIRLSAMMGLRVIYVLTHDSISIGCDGPTHQPVEHLPSLRAIPNLLVIRPADAVETAEAWKVALAQEHTPTALILARERVPTLPRPPHSKPGLAKGAYVFREPSSPRKVTLIATGEQVGMALEAADTLAAENIPAAVVSAPCFELFRQQPEGYRQSVLGTVPRVGIEPAVEGEWSRWLGEKGVFIGMHSFGTCGMAAELYEKFGITPRAIAEAARRLVREESAAGPSRQKG